jgi:hypothetical protein
MCSSNSSPARSALCAPCCSASLPPEQLRKLKCGHGQQLGQGPLQNDRARQKFF